MPYLPQVVGIAFGKAFDLSPLVLMYLGRVANLSASVLVLLAALRAAPFFGWVLLLLSLMPMMMFQMASLSPDGLTNALAFLFIGLVLRLLVANGPVDRKTLATLVIVPVALSLSKQPYALLILLLLAVPARAFGDRRRHLLAFASICAVSLVAMGAWALLTRDVAVPPAWLVPSPDPVEQVRWILDNPRSFVARLLDRMTADQIADALLHAPDGLTRTEISALFGRNLRKDGIERALVCLQKHGLAEPFQDNSGSRPSEVWRRRQHG